MTRTDLAAIVRGLVPSLKRQVDQALEPIVSRLVAVEARSAVPGRDGRDGAPGATGERGPAGESVKGDPGPQGIPGADGSDGKDGKDGKDADESRVAALEATIRELRSELDAVKSIDAVALVQGEVAKAIAELPARQDDTVVDVTRVSALEDASRQLRSDLDAAKAIDDAAIAASVQEAIASLPTPKDGSSVTVEDVAPMIRAQVSEAVAALPVPKDGVSVTVDDVQPVIAEHVAKAVAEIPRPKDGVGVAGAVVDRDGALVLTLSDGTTANLGTVVGRDADQEALEAMIEARLSTFVVPSDGKDGAPGKDGRDGIDFTLADLVSITFDEETRTQTWVFNREGVERSFPVKVPGVMLYRDLWQAGKSYEAGDTVTWSGSLWVCRQDTTTQPGTPNTAEFWRLGAKRGQQGRQGTKGDAGDRGPKGDKGDKGPERW